MEKERLDQLAARFEEVRDKDSNPLQMHALLVSQDGHQFVHRFGGRTGPSDIRSLSKTVLTLIAGTLADADPDFGLETPVWELLEPAVERSWAMSSGLPAGSGSSPGPGLSAGSGSSPGPGLSAGSGLSESDLSEGRVWRDPENLERWKRVRVKHLISHTTGFDQVLMMRGDIKDMDPASYLSYVAASPLKHEPGSHYLYSNAGFYLLSAFLELYLESRGLGSLEDYSRDAFFTPLGIKDWSWEKYGDYLAGATRLWLNPEDLGKIGRLLLAGGRIEHDIDGDIEGDTDCDIEGDVDGDTACDIEAGIEIDIGGGNARQLVPRAWVEHMRTPTTLTPAVETVTNDRFRRHAYGAGMWVGAKEDIFFGHGTGGQTLLVLPRVGAVVVTLADQGDVRALEEVVEEVAQAL